MTDAMDSFRAATRAAAPRVAVVLGSGLGPVVDLLPTIAAIDFENVPGFAAPTVAGHAGRVLTVLWGGVPVLAFRGRMHYYEGHPWDRVAGSVRLAADLGVTTLLLTNAAGGLHPLLHVGDLMAIRAHLPLLAADDWRREVQTDATPYAPELVVRLQALSVAADSPLLAGTYAGVTGPCYETPAEIRALAAMGADAVGMSTVKEALAARALGLQVAAISCITNKAAGLSAATLHHTDVQTTAGRPDVVARLANLIEHFVVQVSAG